MALNRKEADHTKELVEKYGYYNVIRALEDSMSGKWEIIYHPETQSWIVAVIGSEEKYTVKNGVCDCEKGMRGLHCVHQVLVELEKEKEG